ncbi:hypothetical protein ONZ45_g6338 [Pleurotus djamor]|nr:hypothetical protein ONZ45_g6338 [Pleurotus djamor]
MCHGGKEVSPATSTRHSTFRSEAIQRKINSHLQQDDPVPNVQQQHIARSQRLDENQAPVAGPVVNVQPSRGGTPSRPLDLRHPFLRLPVPLELSSPHREVIPAAPAPALAPPPARPAPPPAVLDRGSGLPRTSAIPDIQTSLDWLSLLREASLDRAGFSPAQLDALQNPGPLSIKLYEACGCSRKKCGGDKLLSADLLKRQLEQLSGVFAIYSDMCKNGCIGYTGLYKQLDKCPVCNHLRRKPHNSKPYKSFTTFPIGPQIQAQWSTQSGAANMRCCQRQTQEILEKLGRLDGRLDTYDDFICGSDYLEAVIDGHIHGDDSLLDSAQLYRMKHSDCWIYIWVILNLDPKIRYKVKDVLPAGSIPGPESPKNIDSFLFPSLYHLSTIQNDGGLRIWDGGKREISTTRLQLLFVTADSVALAKAAHWVGHLGKFACRIVCGLPGRRKPGAPQYFMSLLRPDGDTRCGTHGDINLATLVPNGSAARFVDSLTSIIASNNATHFEKQRRETGLTGVSIFFGVDLVFPPPFCFTGDLMHLDGLNLPDLLLGLFRGRNDLVSPTDRVTSWDWAVLRDKDTWETHGKLVANAKPYLPKDIERPPRNPAEKISSGYKASKYIVYLYGLCPALLYDLLPVVYWKHFCKLVRAPHLLSQRSMSSESLALADELLLSYCIDFEHLYYRRRMDRLHFVPPSIHFLLHRALETQRVGPMALLAQ